MVRNLGTRARREMYTRFFAFEHVPAIVSFLHGSQPLGAERPSHAGVGAIG